jgi:ectoine hydroxylase
VNPAATAVRRWCPFALEEVDAVNTVNSTSPAQAIQPLDPAAVSAYHRDGFLLLEPGFLPDGVIAELRGTAPRLLATAGPHRVMERDGVTVRSVYGPHQVDSVVGRVVRLPQLVGAASQLLEDDVYVHQSKINLKAAFAGDQWEWHQDYVYWVRADGIRKPNLINVAVFLEDVTEFNGPLTFIGGSHHEGLLAGHDVNGMPIGYEDAPAWMSTLTATEQFQIENEVIRRLAGRNGMISPKGPAGSVLLFHPNVLHASVPNISPFDRSLLIMVYNGVHNPPTNSENPRPNFLAERVVEALVPGPAHF